MHIKTHIKETYSIHSLSSAYLKDVQYIHRIYIVKSLDIPHIKMIKSVFAMGNCGISVGYLVYTLVYDPPSTNFRYAQVLHLSLASIIYSRP